MGANRILTYETGVQKKFSPILNFFSPVHGSVGWAEEIKLVGVFSLTDNLGAFFQHLVNRTEVSTGGCI